MSRRRKSTPVISTARRHAAPLPDGVRRLARAGWVLMGLALVAGAANLAVCLPDGRAMSGLGLASVVLLGAGAALALIAYGGEGR